MNQNARLARLERGPDPQHITDAELRAFAEPVARHYDVSLDELVDETKKILAMTPAERARCEAELRAWAAEAGDAWPPADL